MLKTTASVLLIAIVGMLAGCQSDSSGVGNDGRPHAPSAQPAPGATPGASPTGAPES
ncbi:hypothetical protein PMPD1_3490 [Paramixta manurensis]|uniref:Uncharacterized protein n=1 Tax=Paramixta manurensis TaxID=2740817 RepID=A0A6M8UJ25_9GAMM|nr:hypothetical protein PMPD1_3490 [Erwiniaceae bacterium PD-1]